MESVHDERNPAGRKRGCHMAIHTSNGIEYFACRNTADGTIRVKGPLFSPRTQLRRRPHRDF